MACAWIKSRAVCPKAPCQGINYFTIEQTQAFLWAFDKPLSSVQKNKIPPNATQHDLRHTAASILIANNMDPRSVAGVLGHADATTTLNIYVCKLGVVSQMLVKSRKAPFFRMLFSWSKMAVTLDLTTFSK